MTRRWARLALFALLWAAGRGAHAMSLPGTANIVDLLEQSTDVVVGKVVSVSDGFGERGVPYTEVTLEVTESIRGQLSGTTTIRQFGLLKPRLTPDGKRTAMPAPPGFPVYRPGEEIVLMLRPKAAWTGFRMPAAVSQGKFNLGPGRVENDMGNAGLFKGVRLERGLATAEDKRMMSLGGPANPEAFLSFVRRAVHGHWVETGRLARSEAKAALPGSVR